MSFYQSLESRIAEAMQADRQRLRNLLRAVQKAEEEGRAPDEQLNRLLAQLDESDRRREARQALVPRIVYDDSLPIAARRDEIAAAIRDNPVVVVSGETGSGKSTQLPKICLEIGRGVAGLIGHTQPRRIAARSIASRLAEELGTSVGQKVGFKVRFTDTTGPKTLIKVMTDGVLLAESQHDRSFDQYDTLIIDEAHERSLNIDFLLGYLKRLIAKRDDLRVIITSATIDAARFAEHFASQSRDQWSRTPLDRETATTGRGFESVPVIEVSGRMYPVEVLYRPLVDPERDEDLDPIRGVADAAEEVCRLGQGDVLVFLPTERDILEAAHKLRGRNLPGGKPDILPLYARLSAAEQNRVFQPHSGRRIVLATNVAESSLTVPGIRYVVDTGTARISRYSPRSKVQRLPIEAVSQASADQRKGRCGRIGPGVCIRLFSEEDYLGRERFTSPEIQRTNLAAVILQLASLDLGPIDEFPFLDPPRPEAIRDGYKTLFELNAIDEGRKLLPLGRQLARLPVDPRIGRMIVEADREQCLADVLIISAALEVQDPRDRPPDRQQEADAAHAQWSNSDSDFVSYLQLWDFVQQLKEQTTRGQFRKACRQHFLSEVRLREWQDVHRQLLEMVQQGGLKAGRRRWSNEASGVRKHPGNVAVSGDKAPPIQGPSSSQGRPYREANASRSPLENPAYAAIHRALLAGLLSSVANRGDTSEYTAAGGGKFNLWPGSGVFAGKPKWIVAAEMVETARRYLRTVARIDPQWIEPLASHLVNRSYSDPHWDRRGQGAVAVEKVSLFGLTIVSDRRVNYGPIDPVESRRLLIEHGLVEGELSTRAEFFRHNRELLAEIERRAIKTRRRELIVDPYRIFQFYDKRLPADAYDAQRLERWRKEAERANPGILRMTEADVLPAEVAPAAPEAFPDRLAIDRLELPLEYRYEPGADRDGVTVTVPPEAIAQLADERLGWLVPGLLEDKLQALIRALPKSVRRNFGPAPDIARKLAGELEFASGPFLSTVAAALSRVSGERITPDMFDLSRLPPHLRLNIRVVDDRGKTIAESRELAVIREQLGGQAPADAAPADSTWNRDGLTPWDFGPLPEAIDIRRGGLVLTRYPALIDQKQSVSLRLCDTLAEARRQTRLGVLRLFVLAEQRELKAQVKWLPQIEKVRLFAAPLAKSQSIDEQLIDLVAVRAFYQSDDVPRDPQAFEDARLIGRRHIVPAVQDLAKIVLPLFAAYHDVQLALEQSHPATWQDSIGDIRQQLSTLLPEGFLAATPWDWLQHFPRYLKAIAARIRKLTTHGVARDRQSLATIGPREQALQERAPRDQWAAIDDAALANYRWMLEELRVSLFAQELGTSQPVSPQRLDRAIASKP